MTQTESRTSDAAAPPRQPQQAREKRRRLPGLRLAVLAGVLLWLACPPATLWPLAWVAVAPLIVSVTEAARFRQAFWRGYLFGWVYLGAVWYWVGLTIVGWLQASGETGPHALIGWAAWFGLTFILAGFYAAWGGAAWWLARRTAGGWRIVVFAAAWVVMEWARTLGMLAMPWAQLSYTQYRFLHLIQIADITGAYGVSFLLMLVNGAVAAGWQNRGQPGSTRWIWASLTVTVLVCLYGAARLAQPETGRPLTVAAMQGDFPVIERPEDVPRELGTFDVLTREAFGAAKSPPSLYVWSESAAPGDALDNPATRAALTALARDYRAGLLVGSRLTDPRTGAEANASVLFLPDGAEPIHYSKQQLVAFGEFIPFRRYLPAFLNSVFHFFDTDVTPGEGATVLRFTDSHAGTVALGPFICYESMYPQYPRAMVRAGANLLVTQSNDAWFQSRAAMEQHLSAVVLRAIENRRFIVRATTTGVTCFLDSRGRILARAPLNTPAFLVRTVRLLEGKTLYTRLGDWFVGLCGVALFIAIGRWTWERRRQEAERARSESREPANEA